MLNVPGVSVSTPRMKGKASFEKVALRGSSWEGSLLVCPCLVQDIRLAGGQL